jgi:hypothetical protein
LQKYNDKEIMKHLTKIKVYPNGMFLNNSVKIGAKLLNNSNDHFFILTLTKIGCIALKLKL